MNIKSLIYSFIYEYTGLCENQSIKRTSETTVTVEHKPTRPELNLKNVEGVGTVYKSKLEQIGISDAYLLSKESPKELSEKLSISEEHAQKFIDSSKMMCRNKM